MTNPSTLAQQGGPPFVADMFPPMNPFLGLLPKKYWPLEKNYFAYSVEYATGSPNPGGSQLAASAIGQSATTQIQADADFLLIALTGTVSATDDSTVIASPPVKVFISDSGSSQGVYDFPQHWLNVIGTAQNPAILPFPRVFKATANITTQLTNLAATARNVRIAFLGFKIFPNTPQ